LGSVEVGCLGVVEDDDEGVGLIDVVCVAGVDLVIADRELWIDIDDVVGFAVVVVGCRRVEGIGIDDFGAGTMFSFSQ